MNNTELTTTTNGALIVTSDQIELVRKTIAPDATPAELDLYLYDCKRQNVHPLDRLLHFTKRGGKYTPITSIDLMRARASDTGELAGNDDAEFEANPSGGFPVSAKVTVWRLVSGHRCPFTATARWNEYYPGDGKEGFMWRKMSHVMLAKCAESLALRKAFPRQLAGLYSREEMDQAGVSSRQDAAPTSLPPVTSVEPSTPQQNTVRDPKPLETAPAPAPSAPSGPKLTQKEIIDGFKKLLEASKSRFISQTKMMEPAALEYFRSLPEYGILPTEGLADLPASSMFPHADPENTAEANHDAIRADRDRHMAGIKAVIDANNELPMDDHDRGTEAASEEPAQQPLISGTVPLANPLPPGTESKRIRVKVVVQKAGTSGKGPWLRFGICDANDTWFNSFDKNLGEKAKLLKGQDATIWYTTGEHGNTFHEIEPA